MRNEMPRGVIEKIVSAISLDMGQMRIAKIYFSVQLIIWLKSFAFFFLYGHGKVLRFSEAAFPKPAVTFDWWFHLAGHVTIGLLALAFGARMEKVVWKKFATTIFAAVALHNFAYWLTAAHPSAIYSVFDFASDSAILALFVLAGHLLWKIRKVKELMAPILAG